MRFFEAEFTTPRQDQKKREREKQVVGGVKEAEKLKKLISDKTHT